MICNRVVTGNVTKITTLGAVTISTKVDQDQTVIQVVFHLVEKDIRTVVVIVRIVVPILLHHHHLLHQKRRLLLGGLTVNAVNMVIDGLEVDHLDRGRIHLKIVTIM